jgi:hypothetical protein
MTTKNSDRPSRKDAVEKCGMEGHLYPLDTIRTCDRFGAVDAVRVKQVCAAYGHQWNPNGRCTFFRFCGGIKGQSAPPTGAMPRQVSASERAKDNAYRANYGVGAKENLFAAAIETLKPPDDAGGN